jgi:hypothetical protein
MDIDHESTTAPIGGATSGLTRRRLLRDAGPLGGTLLVGGSLGTEHALAGLGSTAVAARAQTALSLTPEQEEGPFYVALEKLRKKVRLGLNQLTLFTQRE